MRASRYFARSPHTVDLILRFLFIGSRLCSALLSALPSRRHPCASLVLHLHQVEQGTCTPKLSNMFGTQRKSPGHNRGNVKTYLLSLQRSPRIPLRLAQSNVHSVRPPDPVESRIIS